MNNGDRFDVVLGANTDSFINAMKNLATVAKNTAKKVKDSFSEPDERSELISKYKNDLLELNKIAKMTNKTAIKDADGWTLKAFTNGNYSISEIIDDATDSVEEVGEQAEESKNKFTDMFEKGISKGKKFLLSLFSIRTIWSLISKGANTYIQENEQLNQSIQLTASLLGNTLAPVIKTVANIAQYAMIVISEIIRIFTGYDAIAGTVENANKKIEKSSASASKSLAGFDELQNINTSSGSGGDTLLAQTSALEDFQEKVKEVRDIFNEYETPIKAATVALGALVAVSMVSKIGNLIGTIGNIASGGTTVGTGIAGMGSALAWVAIAALAVGNAKVWSDIINQGIEVGETIQDVGIQARFTTKNAKETSKALRDMTDEGEYTTESLKVLTLSQADNDATTRQQCNDIIKLNSGISGLFTSNSKTTYALGQLNTQLEQSSLDIMENSRKLNLNKTEYEGVVRAIQSNIEQLERNKNNMKKNSDEYDEATTKIENLKTKLKEFEGDYNSTININTPDEIRTTNLIDKVKEFATTGFTAVLKVITDTSRISSLLDLLSSNESLTTFGNNVKTAASKLKDRLSGFIPSYDVGTNYVPNDQLAMVHKGEMIIPAKYNPATSNIGGGPEVVEKLNQLINVLENKQFNAYLDGNKITNTVINGINSKSRQMGESVIK